MTLSPRRVTILALSTLLLGAAASPVWAQVGGLPPAIVGVSSTPTDTQLEQIRGYVESYKADISSTDPIAIRRGRAALESPLTNPAVSITFRIEYGKVLLPLLQTLAASPEEILAANAMHLAGELATPLASDLLTQRGLNDKRPAVRHAAAYGIKRTFEHIRTTSPVFQAQDTRPVIDALSRRIASETDPYVLEGYTRAFEAATTIADGRIKGLRSMAAGALAKNLGEYTRANRASLDAAGAMIRAAQVLRDAAVNQGLPAEEPLLPAEVLREIGGYGGDLIVVVRCALGEPGAAQMDQAARDTLAALAASGENVYYFAHRSLGGTPVALDLAPLVKTAKDQEFIQSSERCIGKAGILAKAPFSLQAQRFECTPPR